MTRLAFARARLVRLAPAFIACAGLTSGWLTLSGVPIPWPVDPVYWTLGYEIGFYAVVWAVLPQLQRGWTGVAVLSSLPVLYWFPLVGWFLVGVVGYEITQRRGRVRQCGDGGSAGSRAVLRSGARQASPAHGLWLRLSEQAGSLSYPLYLLHCTIGRSVLMLLAPLGAWPALGLTSAAMIALAWGVHCLVERPVQAWLRRSSFPWRSHAAEARPARAAA